MLSMDICIYPWISQNPLIIRLMDIRADIERTQISFLSNETDTNIILSAFMDIHLLLYSRGCLASNANWSIYLLITYSYNRLTNNV